MRKVRFKTKPEGVRLFWGNKELPSGERLELKMDQKWVLGTYIFDPNTNSHYLEAYLEKQEQRFPLDPDSKLRYPPIIRLLLPVIYLVAIIADLLFYLRQKLNNRKSK